MSRKSLKVSYIEENNITELKCSKTGKVLPITEFRIHKGYYMSYCKDWEREDNRKRNQAKVWKEFLLNDGTAVKGKTTRMKNSIKIYSQYSPLKLFFDKNEVSLDNALEAYKIYTSTEVDDIKYEYK